MTISHSISDIPRIGQILIQMGKLTQAQVNEVLEYMRQHPDERFGSTAVRLGFVTERDVIDAYTNQMQSISKYTTPTLQKLTINDIDSNLAREIRNAAKPSVSGVLPWIPLTNNRVAITDILDYLTAVETLNRMGFGANWTPVYVPPTEITSAWVELRKGVSEEDDLSKPRKYIENLIRDAALKNVSDIHIHPSDDDTGYSITSRLHGLLDRGNAIKMSKEEGLRLVRSIFSMPGWGLNPNEKTLPQDGAGQLDFEGQVIRFRISTIPLAENRGTSVVIRILPNLSSGQRLSKLGYSKHIETVLTRFVNAPHGLILVTGPTGSGKSTLLYTLLTEVNLKKPYLNIVSVEDPVEARLPFVRQIYGPDERDLTDEQKEQGVPTMTSIQRNILRHDPDVILIGEIRDLRSAQAAIRNAQTGHLVLSTLHANRSTGVITRLIEIDTPGIPRGIVADVLLGVVAQLLKPKLCPKCAVPADSNKVKRILNEFQTRVSGEAIETVKKWLQRDQKRKQVKSTKNSRWSAKRASDLEQDIAKDISQMKFLDYPPIGTECEVCKGLRVVGRVPVAEVLSLSREDRFRLQHEGILPKPLYTLEQDILYRCLRGEISISELEDFLVVA